MSEAVKLELFPKWRQAVADLLAEFKYGDLIGHDWLSEHFGMLAIDDDEPLTALEFRERQFAWLANIESFKTELLEEHQVFLQSVHGKGYRWTAPHEQTAAAMGVFEREAKRLYRQAGQRLKNVRVAELTDDQRRENVDALNKLTMVKGMQRKELR
ncbi:hypothetical protein J2W27_000336 [Variovorax boronicumulans]|uniref:hypothetical protein n=1 Tax=Variovorax boronicumulans TaxID=436515 RepID=UPI0027876825|nr:hypothetical protein [Variovorax boronicumulans]MDP9908243.1 hypothetical protein [Variovorax boronicumulans]